MHKRIRLTRGLETLVSSEDRDLALAWSWCSLSAGKYFYAVRNCKGKSILLHREIMRRVLGRAILKTEEVDHINRDTLDNRRDNLRLVESCQQNWNAKKQATRDGIPTISAFKGVTKKGPTKSGTPRAKPWKANIVCRGKRHWLGYFRTEHEAALAYNIAAEKLFGEYARFNQVY